jgi:predicted nucleic acid-binding protein
LPAVSDTSPLIWLAKVGKINLLKDVFGEIIIPQEVYEEAVEKGLQHGFSDAITIEECVNQGWIKLSKLNPKDDPLIQRISERAFEIHQGEAQAIVLAREMGVLLLMDESAGRAFAEAWGLKVKGTIYVIISALRSGLITKTEAKETALMMVRKGFRLEPNLLAKLLTEIEKVPSQIK